ncbi:MAG: response regulator [Syntrophobacter sp.]
MIDDDRSVRRALQRLLKSLGFDVRVYASARDFPSYGMSIESIIITVVQMPDMEGIESLTHLSDTGFDCPVVPATTYESRDLSERATPGGPVAFQQKPFDDQSLLDAMQLGLSRDRRVVTSSPDQSSSPPGTQCILP